MSLIGLLILIVIVCCVIAYAPLPYPLRPILTAVAIILGVLLLIVVLQQMGVLPSLWGGRPVEIR